MSVLDPTDIFRTEAGELLECLESTLLDLGARPQDRTLVDTAFRALHTLKGSGSMFGFDRMAAFAHDFETAFDLVRQGRVAASLDLVNVALSAKDHIRTLVEDPERAEPIIGEAILAELQARIQRAAPEGGDPVRPQRDALPPDASSGGAAGRDDGAASPPAPVPAVRGWRLGIAFASDILRNGSNPLALLDDLRALGDCTVTPRLDAVPDLEALDPEALTIGWDVTLVGDVSREAIEDVFLFVRDEMSLTLTALDATPQASTELHPPTPTPGPAAPQESVAPVGPSRPRQPVATLPDSAQPVAERSVEARKGDDKAASTVRVQAERLDALMDRVGELVIVQARLSQLAGLRADPAITAISEEIERLASSLRDTTMGIRMVPIGSLFGRFRRLVHDLSRDLAKPVEFVTAGEDTELDKTMIERLADPLVHLIRNAIDHGIEAPTRRAEGGKPATGRIELTAEHAGAQVLVTVRDDGGGLDAARIRAKAEENGLVPPGSVLTDQEVYQFLFAPGFSTAKEISALSGRGVGMDVVKRTIEAMRGSIDLTTWEGAGSAFTLRLPLTLAIIEGLLIRVGEGRYVIPLSAVEECVELPPVDREACSRSLLNIRGDLVPYLRLRDLFGDRGEPSPHQKVIVTAVNGERVGFVADQILGNHQTVIKSLSRLHADVTMFSGATILGDGSAALILDIPQLVAAGQAAAGGTLTAEAA